MPRRSRNPDADNIADLAQIVRTQREHLRTLDAAQIAAEEASNDADDELRRAMGAAATPTARLAELQEAAHAKSRTFHQAARAAQFGREELARLQADLNARIAASARQRHEDAMTAVWEFLPSFAAETDAMLDRFLPRWREFVALRDAAVLALAEAARAEGRIPHKISPVLNEIGRRWPGLLNKTGALAQIAEDGGLPLPPSTRATAPRGEAARRMGIR